MERQTLVNTKQMNVSFHGKCALNISICFDNGLRAVRVKREVSYQAENRHAWDIRAAGYFLARSVCWVWTVCLA